MMLTKYTQELQTALFNDNGAFFAFSMEQFDRQKQEGVKYVHVSNMNMLVPKPNVDTVLDGLAKIHADGIASVLANNKRRDIIKYELANYESYYTGDTSDACDALECYDITPEEVQTVFREELNQNTN